MKIAARFIEGTVIVKDKAIMTMARTSRLKIAVEADSDDD